MITINDYKEVNGTFYHKETSDDVIQALECAYNRGARVVLDYGDVTTGRSWNEVNDIRGTIGRSTGPIRVPLLIKTKRSHGGDTILDNCILSIKDSYKGGYTYYKNPLAK